MALDRHKITLITVTNPRPDHQGTVDEIIHVHSKAEAMQKIQELKERDCYGPHKRYYYVVVETHVDKLTLK